MHNDPETIAEALPQLYRVVLDALGRLETNGSRREARRWREEAIARYSRAWDATTIRRLEELRGRIETFERAQERRP